MLLPGLSVPLGKQKAWDCQVNMLQIYNARPFFLSSRIELLNLIQLLTMSCVPSKKILGRRREDLAIAHLKRGQYLLEHLLLVWRYKSRVQNAM